MSDLRAIKEIPNKKECSSVLLGVCCDCCVTIEAQSGSVNGPNGGPVVGCLVRRREAEAGSDGTQSDLSETEE